MPRIARFHRDPLAHEVSECLDERCEDTDDLQHHEIEVRGEHAREQFSCEHEVHVVIWHELTPANHPEPSCEQGCAMTRELIG
jgi:hypothetical protein